jgi:hypothetical protein
MRTEKCFKWRLLSLALATSVAMTTACSDDDVAETEVSDAEIANTYFQMTVNVSTSSDTRSETTTYANEPESQDVDKGADGKTTSTGTEDECRLTSAYIYLFKSDGSAYDENPIELALTQGENAQTYTSTAYKVPAGAYHAYILFNQKYSLATQGSASQARYYGDTRATQVYTNSTVDEFAAYTEAAITAIPLSTSATYFPNGIPMSGRATQFRQTTTAAGTNVTAKTNEYVTENEKVDRDTSFVTITVAETNTKTNPLQFTVNAERCFAKISYVSAGTEFPLWSVIGAKVDGAKKGDLGMVKLESYALMNVATSYYCFRHVGALEEFNTTTEIKKYHYGAYFISKKTVTDTEKNTSETTFVTKDYVFDPYSIYKTVKTAEDKTTTLACYSAAYLNPIGNLVPVEKSAATSTAITADKTKFTALTASSTLGYVPDNVMTAENQKKGYVTGVIFKAKLKPSTVYRMPTANDELEEGQKVVPLGTNETFTNLWYYQPSKRFYNSLWALLTNENLTGFAATALDGIVNSTLGTETEKTDEAEIATRNSYGIYKYTDGYCYYPFYITHKQSSESEMQPMEYVIVRNNDYQLKVNSVSMRSAESFNLNATEDVELKESYLQATVSILPWTIQINSMDLGNY